MNWFAFLSQGLYLQISTTGKRDPLPTARCLCWNVAQIKSSIWNLSSLSFRANDCATEDSVPLFDCHFSLFLNSFTKLGLLCVSPDSDTNDTTLSESLVTLRRQENTKRRAVHRMCKCARKSQKRGVKKKKNSPGTSVHIACIIILKAGTLDHGSAARLKSNFLRLSGLAGLTAVSNHDPRKRVTGCFQ